MTLRREEEGINLGFRRGLTLVAAVDVGYGSVREMVAFDERLRDELR